MSNKEQVTEQQTEKVMTKYDLKQQKKAEAKVAAKKQKKIQTAIWVLIAILFVGFLASFPIRNAMAEKEVFVKVNGEDISRIEFDYNYNVVKNNYLNSYGSYLTMFGLDLEGDLSKQWYTETLTWEDYFEQQAMESIVRGKALKAEAEAAGFTYDTVEEDYATYVENIEATAEQLGISVKSCVKQSYGEYATLERIEPFIKESLFVNAYYNKLGVDMAPADDVVQAHYEADKNAYDSVDFYQTVIEAAIPTEPTELADPVDETAEVDENAAYQASEAEIEKAMADAKLVAETAEETIANAGELKEDAKYSSTTSVIRDWLYDEARKEGDTTVIEDAISHKYYVLSFVKRYLNETPSANVHIISTTADGGQAILDEWKSGEATEESFAVLADKYNEGTAYTAAGGYYEGVSPTGTLNVIADWLFADGRQAGETAVINTEDGTTGYVLYYAGPNDPEWKLTARVVILGETLENHIQEISKDAEIDDFNNNLEYLEIVAAE